MSFPGCCSDQQHAAAAAVTQHISGFLHHHHAAAAAALPGCQHAHWLCLCSMLLYRFVDEYPCCSIMLWLWTMRTNYMLQAQGLMQYATFIDIANKQCICFKCDLCIFKCTCPCIGPPADMHLCRRVLGRQICRVHMCPGHSVPPTCVGYTDTCSLISHLWHFRTITIKLRSKKIVWLIQT